MRSLLLSLFIAPFSLFSMDLANVELELNESFYNSLTSANFLTEERQLFPNYTEQLLYMAYMAQGYTQEQTEHLLQEYQNPEIEKKQTQQAPKKKFPCPFKGCSSVFSKKSYCSQHFRAKHGNEPKYECRYCGLSLPREFRLIDHERNCAKKPDNLLTPKKQQQKERPHFCGINNCQKSYTRDDTLKRHIEQCHSNKSRFVCNWCGHRFGSFDDLKRHGVCLIKKACLTIKKTHKQKK